MVLEVPAAEQFKLFIYLVVYLFKLGKGEVVQIQNKSHFATLVLLFLWLKKKKNLLGDPRSNKRKTRRQYVRKK